MNTVNYRQGAPITQGLAEARDRNLPQEANTLQIPRSLTPENRSSASLGNMRVSTVDPTTSTKRTRWISKLSGINWIRRHLSYGSDELFVLAQRVLPHHTFSRLFGMLSNCRVPFIKNLLINTFIWVHHINMEETRRHSAREFQSFNDFFTRKLMDGVRPIAPQGQIASPVDGTIGQIGTIKGEQLIQAKDHTYTITQLLGGDEETAKMFQDGKYTTMYLSPSDYHHFHMPVDGKLLWTTHIPGRLFSVNPKTVRNKPELFANNERLIAMFDTEHGPMAMIMVGAINVSSIETNWGGLENPHGRSSDRYNIVHKDYQNDSIKLSKGDDAGDFKLGSTVICLFGKDCNDWLDSLHTGDKVKMGQAISQPSTASGE